MNMNISTSDILARLGQGESIEAVCAAAGMSPGEFDGWWKAESRRRVPAMSGQVKAELQTGAEIVRDDRGIPHVLADNNHDLFVAFGYAMAQDRLFQLDYLRRRAWGRLSEVLGGESLELDLVARTVSLGRIAEAELPTLPEETRELLAAFSAGINACIEQCGECLPIEFDLLGYRAEPWRPLDSLAIAGELRWYLTGRFPVIVIPELARRALGQPALFKAFLECEADDESILPPGSYPTRAAGIQPIGAAAGYPGEGLGSNNWVLSGKRTKSGKPLLASDPHIAFAAVSCWYEVHLCGGSFNVAGMTYAGMPAVMFGRNAQVAWGCTNNICSQRDLYQERTDPAHPDCFLYDGRWEPARKIEEVIRVKGGPSVTKTIRFSRNGPIVDEILPPAARNTGPVSLRWLGREPCGWLPALLAIDRAGSADEFREAARPWLVPTFSLVFCDARGHIGYQCVGRIPVRRMAERGYRPGWDPEHQWEGLIPFEGLPRLADPDRGFAVTANNRPAADDFAYPLSGTWVSGYRARRIREMIAERDELDLADMARMQQDSLSLRAVVCVPRLVELRADGGDARQKQALEYLAGWDCRMEPDRVAATIFDVFFSRWSQAVADQRFDGAFSSIAAEALGGLAARLLFEDPWNWFESADRPRAIRSAMDAALDALAQRFGAEMSGWTWGRLHRLRPRHVLSGRGDLGLLLDHPSRPVRGDMLTVCNTGNDADWQATTGAGYRMAADMADPRPALLAVDLGSQSGHPGSPHYDDQVADWLAGKYHRLPLDRDEIVARERLELRT